MSEKSVAEQIIEAAYEAVRHKYPSVRTRKNGVLTISYDKIKEE